MNHTFFARSIAAATVVGMLAVSTPAFAQTTQGAPPANPTTSTPTQPASGQQPTTPNSQTAPTAPTTAMPAPSGQSMMHNTLRDNPNGSNWLQKFNRPNAASSNRHRAHTVGATIRPPKP